MNILKQNKKNINLSIFLFPIILGIISFSIYVLFCINEFNYIISNSYKISANQLAKSISLSIKIKNIPAVVSLSSEAFITKNSDFIQIIDNEKLIFFHSENKLNNSHCEYNVNKEIIYYENEKIGEINYCFKIRYLSERNNIVLKIIFTIITISIMFSVTNSFYVYKKNKPIYELISNIGKINPSSPSFTYIPNSVKKNQEIIHIYNNINKIIYEFNKIFKEREDMKSQVLLGQLTQMIAHDIKKPFNLLKMMFLNNMNKSSKSDLMHNCIVEELNKNISYVDSLISDVMEIGKPNLLNIEEVELSILAKEVVTEIFEDIKCISKDFKHCKNVFIDKIKIKRVLINIISNALEANKYRGKIWIKTNNITLDNREYIEVSIKNDGSYIPESERKKIFEMFYTKNKKNGTGLGLYICHKIIKSHHGEIFFFSNFKTGTEFIFRIPCFNIY